MRFFFGGGGEKRVEREEEEVEVSARKASSLPLPLLARETKRNFFAPLPPVRSKETKHSPARFSTQATPSSSALCASIGPAITSPIANTVPEGEVVLKCPSVATRPRSSSETPAASKFSPLRKGRRPAETSTTSASSSSAAPPLDDSSERTTPPPEDFFAPVTFVLSLNLKPCFVSERWNAFLISPSIVGTMLGRNSTTVTSEPRRDQTEP